MREPELQGAEDWDAVARAISDRLAETRATQMEVASEQAIRKLIAGQPVAVKYRE